MPQLKLSLLLCLAFLAALAVSGWLITVLVPRTGETVPPSGTVAEPTDEVSSGGTGPAEPIPNKTLEAGGAQEASPPPKSVVGPDTTQVADQERSDLPPAEPLVGGQGPETESPRGGSDAGAPVPGPREAIAPSANRWNVSAASVRAQTFLIDVSDRAGVRRLAVPAPLDQQFALLTISLAWEGNEQQSLVFERSGTRLPTIRLATGQGAHDPLGRMVDPPDPLAPLSTGLLPVPPRERVTVEVAFQLPNDVDSVTLMLDEQGAGSFALPESREIDAAQLLGAWHKMDAQMHPMRQEDALADAIADPQCRLLWISADAAGLPRIEIPTAAVISDEFRLEGSRTAAPLNLTRAQDKQPGWVRLVDDGRMLLLYVGTETSAIFAFQRFERPP